MIIRKDIDLNTPLTTAQAEMLEALADRPVTPDEDCPELTPAQIAQFKQIAAANREDRCKQTSRSGSPLKLLEKQNPSAKGTRPF